MKGGEQNNFKEENTSSGINEGKKRYGLENCKKMDSWKICS